jgi:hypothetical protein
MVNTICWTDLTSFLKMRLFLSRHSSQMVRVTIERIPGRVEGVAAATNPVNHSVMVAVWSQFSGIKDVCLNPVPNLLPDFSCHMALAKQVQRSLKISDT